MRHSSSPPPQLRRDRGAGLAAVSEVTVKPASLVWAALLCIVITLWHYHSLGLFDVPHVRGGRPSSVRSNPDSSLPHSAEKINAPSDDVFAPTHVRKHNVYVGPPPSGLRSLSSSTHSRRIVAHDVVPHQPYISVFQRSSEHVLAAETVDLRAVGNCVGWSQTGNCDPEGPLEPHFSKSCSQRVGGASGYCLCVGGIRVSKVSCGSWDFTCREECDRYFLNHPEAVKYDTSVQHPVGTSDREQDPHPSETEVGLGLARRLIRQQRKLMTLKEDEDFSPNETSQDPFELEVKKRTAGHAVAAAKRAYLQWRSSYAVQQRHAAESSCVAWRQLKGCDSAASLLEHDPAFDRGCGAVIADGLRGYCECGANRPNVHVGCNHRAFTCVQLCDSKFDLHRIAEAQKLFPERAQHDDEDLSASRASTQQEPQNPRSVAEQLRADILSDRPFALAHLNALAALERRQRQELRAGKRSHLSLADQLQSAWNASQHSFLHGEQPLRLVPDAVRDPRAVKSYYDYLDDVVAQHKKRKE